MPQRAWSAKRERQYERIKEGLVERGTDAHTAEEIAARTVNKERARRGEAQERSRASVDEARQRGIRGRSKITKAELERALSR